MKLSSAFHVILGRSKKAVNFLGNRLYRADIVENFEEYQDDATSDVRKAEIVMGIIQKLYDRDGQFLKEQENGKVDALSPEEAKKKVQADLRNKRQRTPSEPDPSSEAGKLAMAYCVPLITCHAYIYGGTVPPQPSNNDPFVIAYRRPSKILYVLADAFCHQYMASHKRSNGKQRIVNSIIRTIERCNGTIQSKTKLSKVSQAVRDSWKDDHRRRRGAAINDILVRQFIPEMDFCSSLMRDPFLNAIFLNFQGEEMIGGRNDEDFIGVMYAAAEIDVPVPSTQSIDPIASLSDISPTVDLTISLS